MMIWAPLTKSPNCASQTTSASLLLDRVAVLEAERGVLRQQRVVDPELALVGVEVGERAPTRRRSRSRRARRGAGENVPRRVSWPARRMSVPSSSSEPNASASASGPVDLAVLGTSWSRVSNCLASLGWTVKPSGSRRHARRRSASSTSRLDAGVDVGQHADRPAAIGLAWTSPSGGVVGRVSSSAVCSRAWKSSSACSASSMRDVAPLDERLGVELADRAPGVDALVHQRLRVARVVALVVAVAPVADHVDDDVLVEPLPVTRTRAGRPGRTPRDRRRSRGRSAPATILATSVAVLRRAGRRRAAW